MAHEQAHIPEALYRIPAALLPLVLTPLFVWLIGEGYLDFGGGEKDLIMVFPWLLWSIFFLVAFLVCWRRKVTFGRSLVLSVVVASGCLALAFIILYLFVGYQVGMRG